MNPFKASVAFNIETSYFLYSKTKDWFPYEMQPLGWNWLNQVKTGTRKISSKKDHCTENYH